MDTDSHGLKGSPDRLPNLSEFLAPSTTSELVAGWLSPTLQWRSVPRGCHPAGMHLPAIENADKRVGQHRLCAPDPTLGVFPGGIGIFCKQGIHAHGRTRRLNLRERR